MKKKTSSNYNSTGNTSVIKPLSRIACVKSVYHKLVVKLIVYVGNIHTNTALLAISILTSSDIIQTFMIEPPEQEWSYHHDANSDSIECFNEENNSMFEKFVNKLRENRDSHWNSKVRENSKEQLSLLLEYV